MAIAPPDVFATLRVLAAEAATGAPVCDSQILVLAATGDIHGLRMALKVNKAWRAGLAAGDRQVIAGALGAAVATAERGAR